VSPARRKTKKAKKLTKKGWRSTYGAGDLNSRLRGIGGRTFLVGSATRQTAFKGGGSSSEESEKRARCKIVHSREKKEK